MFSGSGKRNDYLLFTETNWFESLRGDVERVGDWCSVIGVWCLVIGAWGLVIGDWCLVIGVW